MKRVFQRLADEQPNPTLNLDIHILTMTSRLRQIIKVSQARGVEPWSGVYGRSLPTGFNGVENITLKFLSDNIHKHVESIR